MAVDVGSAVGYLDLDISGFLSGLKNAQGEADTTSKNIATNLGNNLQSTGKSLKSAGSTLTKGFTVPLVAAGTAAFKFSADFETAMAKISTIADPAAKSISAIQKEITDLSNKTGMAASDLAEATYEAISSGINTADAVKFTGEASKLAAAGFTDASSAVDVLTTILNAYGLSAEETTHISDVLIKTQNLGKTTVDELSSSIGRVIPTANAFGVSVEQLGTAYSFMTSRGIATTESTTYLNGMLNELGKSGTTVSDTLQKKTGKSFQELMADGYSLRDVLGILQESADEAGVGFNDLWQSQEASKAALSLAGVETEKYNSTLKDFQQTVGDTDSAYEKMSNTTEFKLNVALQNGKNALITLGDTIKTMLLPFIEEGVEWLKKLNEWLNSLTDKQKEQIVKIAAVVAAAGPLLMIIGKVVSGVGKIVTAFGNLTSKGGDAAGSIGGVGSAASDASGGVGSAAASFGNLAGQALKLVATGVTLMMVGVAIKMIADSSIEVANAGPGAAATFVLLAAVGVGMAAAIAAIGGASTATAPGLLALGATVLMVSGGVALMTGALSLVIDSMSNLVTSIASASTSLPLIAEYGGSAAAALTLLAGGVVLVSGAMLMLAVSTVAGLLPFVGAAVTIGLVDVALTAMLVTSGLAAVGMLLLGASLKGVEAQMSSIKTSAKTSAESLEGMVSSINIVDSFLSGLESTVESVVKSVIDSFSGIERPVSDFGTKMQTASSTATAAMSSMSFSARKESTAIVTSFNSIVAAVTSMSSKTIVAFNAFVSSFRSKANEVRSEIKSLEEAFSDARFEFDGDIKLPHFKMSGSFNAQTGSVPSVDVSWYRKAMASGMILNGATIFGYDPSTRKFLGGGEAGSEAVVGTSSLMKMIRMSVNAALVPFVVAAYKFIKSNIELDYITRNAIVKQDEVVSKLDKTVSRTSGDGDTFNFYSPKPIDEIEAACQLKKTKRDLSEGF